MQTWWFHDVSLPSKNHHFCIVSNRFSVAIFPIFRASLIRPMRCFTSTTSVSSGTFERSFLGFLSGNLDGNIKGFMVVYRKDVNGYGSYDVFMGFIMGFIGYNGFSYLDIMDFIEMLCDMITFLVHGMFMW